MSEKFNAMHKAIADYIQEELDQGNLMLDWVMGYSTITPRGTHKLGYITAETASPAGSMGLAEIAAHMIRDDITPGPRDG